MFRTSLATERVQYVEEVATYLDAELEKVICEGGREAHTFAISHPDIARIDGMCDNETHALIGCVGDAAKAAVTSVSTMQSRLSDQQFCVPKGLLQKLSDIQKLATSIVILVFIHQKLRVNLPSRAKRAAAMREMRKTLNNKGLSKETPDGLNHLLGFWVINGELESYNADLVLEAEVA